MIKTCAPWVAAMLLLAGCGGAPAVEPPPPPVVVTVSLTAAADSNPDGEQRPSPLVVRLYELGDAEAFNSANFFDLWNREPATLAAALVKRHEFVIAPSGKASKVLTLDPRVQAIGVAAAYRDIRNAQWRVVAPLSQAATAPRQVELEVSVSSRALTITPKHDTAKTAGIPQ